MISPEPIQNIICLKLFGCLISGIIRVNNAVTKKWGVPALKAAMDYIGLFGGTARKPILPLDEAIKAELFKVLDDYNIKS